MDAFSESYQIVKNLIVIFIELFKDDDVLVALLLGLRDDVE